MTTAATAEISEQALKPMPNAEPMLIRSAAVLGAGTMGSRIAAHLANCGIPVLLLDIVPATEADSRNKLATSAIEALLKAKPAAFYEPNLARLVTPGNFEDDLPKLASCDWVIEAVTENLEVKQSLLTRVLPHIGPSAILTTNTSGLPIAQIAKSLGNAFTPSFSKRWFGTHFFNPPRYMRLLEVIPTTDTDPAIVAALSAFADRILGKQVVLAHDTPNFIANRIGTSNMFAALTLMQQQGLTVEEVDALTGTAIGWPRTGTFRLADMVGIDILAHVASNFREDSTNDSAQQLIGSMVERRWLGDKTGQGFYKKARNAGGEEERLALDLNTLEYRPLAKAKIPSLEMAKNAASLPERLRMLLANDPKKDKAAAYLLPLLANLWSYAADRIGEVADDAPSIDRAICAGFNWELGPFAMWDAAGVPGTVARLKELGLPVSPRVEALLSSGFISWYSTDGSSCYSPITGQMEQVAKIPGHATIADFRSAAGTRQGVVRKNTGASLVDLGDGIGCLQLHSVKSAIGGDVVSLLSSVLNPTSDAVRDFRGFVISSDQENFSVGANLMQLLLAMQEGEWSDVNLAIRNFQQMTAAIKFCPRPVVVAPFGMCLGGGTEICMHATTRQVHAELYMGLVEAGVGLIPGGGGTKEMALRAHDLAVALVPPEPRDPPAKFAQSGEYATALKRALETIAMAKVSTSAAEARSLGLLAPSDSVTRNRARLLLDAKAQAILLAEQGYVPPIPRSQIPVAGLAALSTLETGIFLMGEAGFASEHDQKVARKTADVLCGGRLTPGSPVSEQYLLDLEREAFLSLCGERKTQERIAHTLKTGKPLRN
ncbi:3-hydroxyacyl-CoA dehydrogenase/enoyl-CoA hydratase family protein [Acidicapsa acidisoli]|uniref:3-hydroxyacyl-CoA dehydrogenase/enoyl-CoA hydratase family protein n=1 Tax=Acidicapsa acidisoli TaxID=1615681 RepID=UPI0021E007CE|nr:3-hydroxyacyl-CoA dehydrogenase/enoyl-CoA hydratase family protein [Acidicapsa acidisoli]